MVSLPGIANSKYSRGRRALKIWKLITLNHCLRIEDCAARQFILADEAIAATLGLILVASGVETMPRAEKWRRASIKRALTRCYIPGKQR